MSIKDTELKVGDKVIVKPDKRGQIICIVSPKNWGGKYYGIRYCDKRGDCDGQYKNERYFYCPKGYGQYVKHSLIKEILSPGCNFDYLNESKKLLNNKKKKDLKYKTNKNNLKKLKQLFKDNDKDGNLTLNEAEFIKLATKALMVDVNEASLLFKSIDVSGNGDISFAEFDSWLGNGGITKIEEYGKMREAFKKADKDGNLTLDIDEFCKLALESMDLDNKSAKELFNKIDTNKNGDISFTEFEAYIDDIGGLKNIKEFSELKKHFAEADKDNNNGLDLDEFIKLAKDKLNIPSYKAKKLFNNIDTDKSGSIQFVEFCVYIDKLGGVRKLDKDEQKIDDAKESEQEAIIFQLGTNNWQVSNEAAPGSGILHEAHHQAYSSMPNVKSYSIYPSKNQKNKDLKNEYKNFVKIYELDKDIPICESISPVSSRRWHGMSQKEIDEYINNLEKLTYDYLLEIEKQNKPKKITFCIAHHTFMNTVILNNVMNKRKKNGLDIIPCVVYVHGTGLKMYQNELKKLKEYPSKFYPMIQKLELFCEKESIYKAAIAISTKAKDEFQKIFPKYPNSKIILSLNGINTKIFKHNKSLKLIDTLSKLKLQSLDYLNMNGDNPNKKEINISKKLKYLVLFVGKLADWKRADAVLYGASTWESKYNDQVLTLLIGGGSKNDFITYQKLNKKLKNKSVHFLGPLMQDVLCQLYNITNVGVFPSKNEPFGMVLVECMACGTPVICADSGGPKEFVSKDVGFRIKETDDHEKLGKEIGKKVVEYLENDEKSKKQEACLRVAKGFTVANQCKKLFSKILEFV